MRAGQRSSGSTDRFVRQKTDAEFLREVGPGGVPMHTAFPEERRYSASSSHTYGFDPRADAYRRATNPSFDVPDGHTEYATLDAHMPMELPNFDVARDRSQVALKWTPDPYSNSSAIDSEVISDASHFPTQLFTHIPGEVRQAETDRTMEHAAPTLAALAHREMPHTVPMNQPFNRGTLYIPREVMDEMAGVKPLLQSHLDPTTVSGHTYSDADVGMAQEEALENAFPTSLNATSRRKSFQGEQGRLF